MTKRDAVEVSGIWLRNIGEDMEVLAEVGGRWVVLISYRVGRLGQQISHIVEPEGVRAVARRQGVT